MWDWLAGISCFRDRKSSAHDPVRAGSAAQHLAHDARGIVHRRYHPGIVEPGRADQAENSYYMAGAVAIGGDYGGGARQREQLVLRPDENSHAFGAFRATEQVDHAAL